MACIIGVMLGSQGNADRAVAQVRPTVSMREKVYEKLSKAQESAEGKDYAKAFEVLADVESMKDLNAFEKARLYTAYGYIFLAQEKYAESIGAYEKVLLQENLPEALTTSTLYTLAQLQFQVEGYEKAINYLERWLATATNPGPEPFVLLAQAEYRLGRYREAVVYMEQTVGVARQRGQAVKEEWYLLQRVLYYEIEDYANLLQVFEALIRDFPHRKYWLDLAAAYGAAGDAARQLATYGVAYEQGYLDSAREILLFAQLLLRAEVPYRAALVLAQAMESGAIEGTLENYRLLSQAWTMAHEDAKAIEALTLASALSSDGELDARLAQSYANLDNWQKTVEMVRSALRKGVKDAQELQVLLGMALFELGRYDEAKEAFRTAQQSPARQKIASQWITHIEREEERIRQLQHGPG